MILLKIFSVLFTSTYAFASHRALQSQKECVDKHICGDVTIPYPFGMGANCSLPGFEVMCNQTKTGTYIPYLYNFPLIDINISAARVRINHSIAWECHDSVSNTKKNGSDSDGLINLLGTPFRFSKYHNKLIVTGCRGLGQINMTQGGSHTYFPTGCISFCNNADVTVDYQHQQCTGIGCCQTNIPANMAFADVTFDETYAFFPSYNPCRYAALMEAAAFNFTTSYINTTYPDADSQLKGKNVSVLLDWTIGNINQTCENPGTPEIACKSVNSSCLNASSSIGGYTCNCTQGFQGNPYLEGGCTDFNECLDNNTKWCPNSRKCHNTIGGYWCSCPLGWRPSTMNSQGPCLRNTGMFIGFLIATGIGICVFLCALIYAAFMLKRWYDLRQIINERNKNSSRHFKMVSMMPNSSNNHITKMMTIFGIEELEKATSNFDPTLIVGQGGHGVIFKGILSDKRVVAIKRPKISDDRETREFLNEVLILSQLNHRNVVKVYGCCLENEVPLVVYEFISNGTLTDHLHVREGQSLSWNDRLNIAVETAGALSYLHSASSILVLHRDIKTANILLNDAFSAKLSDFGTSRIVPIGDTSAGDTIVQGTLGYLDPEYLRTSRLTAKSDVYSFGVILAELLTRKSPFSQDDLPNGASLVSYFCSMMKEGRLHQILDQQILKDQEHVAEFESIALLAEKCMREKGEERPTMKEVEMHLEVLYSSNHRSAYNRNNRDNRLVEQPSLLNEHLIKGDTSSVFSWNTGLKSVYLILRASMEIYLLPIEQCIILYACSVFFFFFCFIWCCYL